MPSFTPDRKSYEAIRANIIATWPALKRKLANETLLISKHAKKLPEDDTTANLT